MLPVTCLVIFVTVLNLHMLAANVAKSRELPIQFPEPVVQTAAEKDDVPASCKDLTYCTVKPANYPEEKFNELFKDYKAMPQPELIVDLNNRVGEGDGENCVSDASYEPLYRVREKRDQPWRMVVQAPGHDYVQRVRLETCRNVGAPCFESFCMPSDQKLICKQNYNTWEVLVAKGDNETEKIKTELPISCSCTAVKLDFLSRFGGSNKPEPDGPCFTNFPQLAELVTLCKQKVTTWEILTRHGKN